MLWALVPATMLPVSALIVVVLCAALLAIALFRMMSPPALWLALLLAILMMVLPVDVVIVGVKPE
jgi:hypothetical protein